MIIFPSSTVVNKFLPKEKFYSKTSMSSKLKQLFTQEIEKITWSYKISPGTLNITAGEHAEIQVFEILIKGSEISRSVLKLIDTYIPYPILFIVYKNGSKKAVISYKELGIKNKDTMKVDSYFDTGWVNDLDLSIKGRTVDDIYKNFLLQVAPNLKSEHHITTKEAVEQNKVKQDIQKRIDGLNKQIRNELSLSKKQALARLRYSLEQKINNQ